MKDKGFWGGFVKSFRKSSSVRRKKRSTANATTSDVQINTVVLFADPTNPTDLKDSITNNPNLTAVSGSIKGKTYENK